ncbi:MAG: hypothetical protein Q9227_004267 [Pyrenula ochraceoflavens]
MASTEPLKTFKVTAISAANGKSTLECWELEPPIQQSSSPGTAGAVSQQLGQVANATYTILPAHFDGGLHNAPAAQYVAFLSGVANVTLPDSDEKVVIEGGADGLIIAADTADVSEKGHITKYPGDTPTMALSIPFRDGEVPRHKVLHKGPCCKDETRS